MIIEVGETPAGPVVDDYIPRSKSSPSVMLVVDYTNGRTPLEGAHYYMMKKVLGAGGIDIGQCAITHALPGINRWDRANYSGIKLAVSEFSPDIIFTLGKDALKVVKGGGGKLADERGHPSGSEGGTLVLPTYHPRDTFKDYALGSLLKFDIRKGLRLATGGWGEPVFNINYRPTYDVVLGKLRWLRSTRRYISVDYETFYSKDGKTPPRITCVGIAWSKRDAIVVPFIGDHNDPYWSMGEEMVIWSELSRTLEACSCLGANCIAFDHRVGIQVHGLLVRWVDDTQILQWSLGQELPKSLAHVSSLYTDVPYWKGVLKDARSGKIPYWEEYLYCGKDACITYEVALGQRAALSSYPVAARDNYSFNIRCAKAYLYMGVRGCRVDEGGLASRLVGLKDEAAGYRSEVEVEVGGGFNANSPKQVQRLLYDELKLPRRYKIKTDGRGRRETADYLTTLYLAHKFPEIGVLQRLAELKKMLKRISVLAMIKTKKGGYIEFDHGMTGDETGRPKARIPANKLGAQAQNMDRRDRDLFLPYPGEYWCSAYLKDAGPWTIAAQLASLGDRRLLDDLGAGVGPGQVLAGVMAEAINHCTANMMTPRMMHTTIFKDSGGELFVGVDDCAKFQDILLERYNYGLLHSHMAKVMDRDAVPYLDSASGARRYFYGRKDPSTVRGMLAHIPQNNTAYVINRFILELYEDPGNRGSDGGLVLNPMNQVGDGVGFGVPEGGVEMAKEFFYGRSPCPITVDGIEMTIPFEAWYGDNWGEAQYTL